MALHPHYHYYMAAFNDASAACVTGDRTGLARAVKRARKLTYAGTIKNLIAHLNYVGWPIRLRPNGRYL